MILIRQIAIFSLCFQRIFDRMYDCIETLRQIILENVEWSSTIYTEFIQLYKWD